MSESSLVKGFVSSIYEKASTQRNTLIQHQKVHARERCYECSHCGKLFSHKSCFLAHQRFNCGGMLYDCRECENFSQRKYLIAHKKIHTGEKPYECKECSKSLSKSGAYWTPESSLEKSLISATNVENFCSANPISLHMKDFTLEKTFMSAANVGSSLLALVSIIIWEFTLEKDLWVQFLWESSRNEQLRHIWMFTSEKSLMSAVNVGNLLQVDRTL